MDLKGAYDGVNAEKLVKMLINLRIPVYIVKFIAKTISGRRVHGFYGGISLGSNSTNKGLTQGSILSPLLFNLYISQINHYLGIL